MAGSASWREFDPGDYTHNRRMRLHLREGEKEASRIRRIERIEGI
jgi:hypothetical protein